MLVERMDLQVYYCFWTWTEWILCIDTYYLSTIAGSRYGIPVDVSHVNMDTESFVLSAFLKLQTGSSP